MKTSLASPVITAIQLLGGPSKLARRMGLPVSTVGSWNQSGRIPSQHQAAVLAMAKSLNVPLTASDLIDPATPNRVGPVLHGPTVHEFSTPSIPAPQPQVREGEYLEHILKLSEGQLVLCFVGTGSAFAKRNDQTSLIIAKDRKTILVDCGSTVPQALYRNGMDITKFDYYHLTHAHADHVGGLEELFLKYRYMIGRKVPLIITPSFQKTLWEHSLKGGCEVNEPGLLKFCDLIEPLSPKWVKNQPREIHQITIDGIHLQIFRTIHTPGDVDEWEKAFWSTGLVIDGKVLFSADTRFDPTIFTDICMDGIDTIFHDCQLFSPGKVHATYEELKTLPGNIRAKMYLTHYGDTFHKFDAVADGFAGFARPFTPYVWPTQ